MKTDDLGLLAAVAGLVHLLSFAQTSRSLLVNRVSMALGLLTIPLSIAALWRIALEIGWWTALVFIAASLLVGAIHAVIARRNGGIAAIYSLQPTIGCLALIFVALSWFLR